MVDPLGVFRQAPRPDYPYPLAHLHVNGRFLPGGTETAMLHIPTRRVPLEMVLWHLVAEWDVRSKRSDWREFLGDSISGFEERRTVP